MNNQRYVLLVAGPYTNLVSSVQDVAKGWSNNPNVESMSEITINSYPALLVESKLDFTVAADTGRAIYWLKLGTMNE